MKKIILILISALFVINADAQTPGTPIFSTNNGVITTNSTFIKPFYTDGSRINTIPYTLINPLNFSVGNVVYTLRTGIFEEPGYSVISITNNKGVSNVLLKMLASWIKIHNEFRTYTDNDYFLKIPLSSTATAIAFIGKSYNSEPELLTIIVLTENDAKLVFNQNLNINTITKGTNSYSMAVQSNVQEQATPTSAPTPAITHRIWLENGVLMFANN